MRSRYAGFRSWFCVLLVVHCTLSQGQDNKAEFAAKILTTLTSLPDCKLVYTFKQIGLMMFPHRWAEILPEFGNTSISRVAKSLAIVDFQLQKMVP